MTLKLEVGKRYETISGMKVTITGRTSQLYLPFLGANGSSYREDGGWAASGSNMRDLIKEIPTVASKKKEKQTMTGLYKIEKNVPLPDGISTATGNAKYPFATMLIGDSFLVPATTVARAKIVAKRLSVAVAGFYKTPKGKGKKFTISSKVKGGVRIWRIK